MVSPLDFLTSNKVMWQVILSREAQKHYNYLSKSNKGKVKKKLLALQENPLSGKKLTGSLTNYRSLRVWPYRIIYTINKQEQKIEVSDILHRQGAYR